MVTPVKALSNERKAAITAGTSIIIMALAAFFPMVLSMKAL
ncbi:hypothetical protein [Brevibacillus laterosporus]